MKSQQSFEANLVMSTLEPEDVSMYQNTSMAKENANVSKNSAAKRATRVIEEDETRNTSSKRKRITSDTDTGTLGDDDDELFNFENPKEHLESIEAVRMNVRNDDGPAGTDSENALLTSNVYDKEISSLPLATVRETRRNSQARHKTQNTELAFLPPQLGMTDDCQHFGVINGQYRTQNSKLQTTELGNCANLCEIDPLKEELKDTQPNLFSSGRLTHNLNLA